MTSGHGLETLGVLLGGGAAAAGVAGAFAVGRSSEGATGEPATRARVVRRSAATHQAGIVTPAQDRLHFAAFDVTTDDRDQLDRRCCSSGPRRPSG